VSSRYTICGWVRVRKCAEVGDIIKELQDRCGHGIEIDAEDVESDQLDISVEGGSLFATGYVLGIKELLDSLGPYTSVVAVFGGECDGQPWELVVAPLEEAGRVALSQSRLEEIDPLVDDLTTEDRARLVAKLQTSAARGQPHGHVVDGEPTRLAVLVFVQQLLGGPMLDQFKNVTRKRVQALLAVLVALVAAIAGCDSKPGWRGVRTGTVYARPAPNPDASPGSNGHGDAS
jgi:hypothetical protein